MSNDRAIALAFHRPPWASNIPVTHVALPGACWELGRQWFGQAAALSIFFPRWARLSWLWSLHKCW